MLADALPTETVTVPKSYELVPETIESVPLIVKVPVAWFAKGQSQCMFMEGTSSPIMNVLLVPSMMSVSLIGFLKSSR